MKLGERIQRTLSMAGLTPRHLGGATRVHFVTIYRIMDDEEGKAVTASTEYVLTHALNKIDRLLEDKVLPFTEKLNQREKTAKLKALLDDGMGA